MFGVLALPTLLTRVLDAKALAFLTPPGAPGVDFAAPPGEPALSSPDSVSWRVFRNPVTLFVGGVAAVLLELAEPRVRHGVWDHTSFRDRPLERLQRTGLAAMVTVYAAQSVARAMIAGIGRAHARVAGVTPDGIGYRADDPELLDWVQATASFGFLEAYSAFARQLSGAEHDRGYAEALPAARLFGAVGAPASRTQAIRLVERMLPALGPSPIIGEFLEIMAGVPAFPPPARPLQRACLRAAVHLLPIAVRRRVGLTGRLSARERTLVTLAARGAERLFLPSAPWVEACRRLGLPPDYLYSSPARRGGAARAGAHPSAAERRGEA